MTISYTRHYRFGIPDFLAQPWHAEWAELVHHIDRALYQSTVLDHAILWTNDFAWVVGDVAIDPADGRLWVNRVAHVSASPPTTFAQDRAANPAFWEIFATPTPSGGINIEVIIDGGSSVIVPGVKADLEVSFNGLITKATLLSQQVGDIVVDVWKDSYGNFPPDVSDSITGGAKPTLLGAAKSQDSTLVGWNTTLTAGDTLRFNVDSASVVQRVTLSLECQRA